MIRLRKNIFVFTGTKKKQFVCNYGDWIIGEIKIDVTHVLMTVYVELPSYLKKESLKNCEFLFCFPLNFVTIANELCIRNLRTCVFFTLRVI